ncbi:MAG: hypothetical protein ACKOEO_21580 [Planctomycetaceae bacterium]
MSRLLWIPELKLLVVDQFRQEILLKLLLASVHQRSDPVGREVLPVAQVPICETLNHTTHPAIIGMDQRIDECFLNGLVNR